MAVDPNIVKKLKSITNPLIRKRYLKYFQLPQDLRQIMFALETADKINKISQKNNLNVMFSGLLLLNVSIQD